MSTVSDIEQAFCEAIETANGLTGNNKVIPDNDAGPKPNMPFCTVKVLMANGKVGEDEDINDLDDEDDPQVSQRGQRRGTASVQAFGDTASTWLENFVGKMRAPSVVAVFDAAYLDVEPLNDPVNLSQLLETGFDVRWAQDFEFLYAMTTEPEALTEAATVKWAETDVSTPDNLSHDEIVTL